MKPQWLEPIYKAYAWTFGLSGTKLVIYNIYSGVSMCITAIGFAILIFSAFLSPNGEDKSVLKFMKIVSCISFISFLQLLIVLWVCGLLRR